MDNFDIWSGKAMSPEYPSKIADQSLKKEQK